MKCPRCVQKIHRAAETCPHCGFSLADADHHFGHEDVALRALSDTAGLFRRPERKRIEAAQGAFARRFPQLFVGVYTGSGGGSTNLRQFGFWLLNRAAFEDVPPEKPNAAGILLVLDPAAKAATISHGYLLDAYLDESDTFDCLIRAHSWWLEGRHAEGVLRVIRRLDAILRKRSRQARRDPARFEKRVRPPAAIMDRMRPLRDGHRAKVAGSEVAPRAAREEVTS